MVSRIAASMFSQRIGKKLFFLDQLNVDKKISLNLYALVENYTREFIKPTKLSLAPFSVFGFTVDKSGGP